MKLFSKIFIVTLLFIIGCSENQNINSPNIDSRLTKLNDPVCENYLDAEEATILLDVDDVFEWVSIPLPGLVIGHGQDYIIKSEMVFRDQEKTLIIEYAYETENHDSVKLTADLKFDKHSIFEDSLLITMKIDTRNGTLIFEPHTQFDRHIHMNYLIEGIDVSELDPNEIDFIYGAPDGTFQNINYDQLTIDEVEGSIYLKRAHLTHFSRYGFVRRNPNF